MKTIREIQDRIDGGMNRLDGTLHPQVADPIKAAHSQGAIEALAWVLDSDGAYSEPRDRREDIEELYGEMIE